MKGFRMTDEYKKLHASLAVLGSAIKKVEAHLVKHPARDKIFVNVDDVYYHFYPDGHYYEKDMEAPRMKKGVQSFWLGMDIDSIDNDRLMIHYVEDGCYSSDHFLSDCSSREMVAYSKYLPELIRLADESILELADEAENIAGEIDQALAAAAKKPERKPKAKAKA